MKIFTVEEEYRLAVLDGEGLLRNGALEIIEVRGMVIIRNMKFQKMPGYMCL